MKFTSEDLMKAMGLQVGDRVKTDSGNIFIITRHIEEGIVITQETAGYYSSLEYLVDTEFEILPRPKRVGDLKCNLECDNCPLVAVCAMYDDFEELTLYEVLEHNNSMASDQEIYDLLKARLDKEVVEE